MKKINKSKRTEKGPRILLIEALEMLVALGNNSRFIDSYRERRRAFRRDIADYLQKQGYVESIEDIGSRRDYRIYEARLTKKGRDLYKGIKYNAKNLI